MDTRPAAAAGSVTWRTISARRAGSAAAVASDQPAPSRYACGPSSGTYSGSSGASRASDSARCTTARSPSSSSRFVVALPVRVPTALRTVTCTLALSPAVEIWFTAKRVFASPPLDTFTRVSSAVANESTRCVSARIASRSRYGADAAAGKSERGPLTTAAPC